MFNSTPEIQFATASFTSGMFCSTGSRIVMEIAIENLPANSRCFSLSGEELTVAYSLEHLSAMTSVDLSENRLRHLRAAHHMQFVRELNLSSNSLTDCHGFELMPRLETLDLSHNGESTADWLF